MSRSLTVQHPGLRSLSALALLILSLALGVFCARADVLSEAFDTANKLYEQGHYEQAVTTYEKLVAKGLTSPALYFNLGNACFKAGHIGQAIAAYRQANELTPRDPDLRANLQFARNQVQGPTLTPSRFQAWLGKLSLNEWTGLAAGTGWAWLLLLSVMQWRPALRPALRNYALGLGALAAVLVACFGVSLQQHRFTQMAIVVAPEAVVRQAPLEESSTAFTAHDGAELQVLDQKDEWLQVTTGPRFLGWVQRKQVAVRPGI